MRSAATCDPSLTHRRDDLAQRQVPLLSNQSQQPSNAFRAKMLPPLSFAAKLPVTTQTITTLPHRTRASASKTCPSAADRLHDPPPPTPLASTSKSFIAPLARRAARQRAP